jgi:NAD+ synthase
MLLLNESQLDEARKIIENSIQTRVRKAHAEGGVVGLSGGIDSTLVTTLAHRALGDRLLALHLPEEGVNRPEDTEAAERWAAELGVPYRSIEIRPLLEPLEGIYRDLAGGKVEKIAWANVKPKIRMTLLYLIANLENRLVIGTGNKTELLLGYTTKFGDSGVDLQPIGDLYKTQVRQLARYLGVPEEILEKPPSPGLWPGQETEEELGARLEEIDETLYLLVERGYSPREAAQSLGKDREFVERIAERIRLNEHKRKAPTITRLTNMCLDKDWRYPVEGE